MDEDTCSGAGNSTAAMAATAAAFAVAGPVAHTVLLLLLLLLEVEVELELEVTIDDAGLRRRSDARPLEERVMLRRLRLVTHMIDLMLLLIWVGWGSLLGLCGNAGRGRISFCFRWSMNFRVMHDKVATMRRMRTLQWHLMVPNLLGEGTCQDPSVEVILPGGLFYDRGRHKCD